VPRPSFRPTKEQRKMVRSLAAIGMRHDQIAIVIGVRSPKTLRKRFRKELALGSTEAFATVIRIAYEMATSGEYPEMTDWWLSTIDTSSDAMNTADEEIEPRSITTVELVLADPAAEDVRETEARNAP
jgi:hypothetical protein